MKNSACELLAPLALGGPNVCHALKGTNLYGLEEGPIQTHGSKTACVEQGP